MEKQKTVFFELGAKDKSALAAVQVDILNKYYKYEGAIQQTCKGQHQAEGAIQPELQREMMASITQARMATRGFLNFLESCFDGDAVELEVGTAAFLLHNLREAVDQFGELQLRAAQTDVSAAAQIAEKVTEMSGTVKLLEGNPEVAEAEKEIAAQIKEAEEEQPTIITPTTREKNIVQGKF